jgi:hypothetical protein
MTKLLGFAALLALLSCAQLAAAASGPVPPCDPNGRNFCGLEGAEDIAFIPGTDWMLVGSQFINVHSKQRIPFAISATPPQKASSHVSADLSAPDCPGPPTYLRVGANDIKRVGSEVRIVEINHPDPKTVPPAEIGGRVELFSVELPAGIPELHWLGCFPVPLPYNLNDVAIAPDGTIYASHQHDRPHTPEEYAALRQKWLAHEPTGFALQWKHGAGWVKVPGTDVPFANGVGVSYDGRQFAVAGTYCECLVLVDRRTGATRRVPIGVAPDNITPLRGGGFIAEGNTGAPVTGVDPCRPPGARPCGFPIAVVQIDPKGLVTYLFESDGSRIPGTSVAVLHGGELFMGSAFADFVTVVDRPAGAPLD